MSAAPGSGERQIQGDGHSEDVWGRSAWLSGMPEVTFASLTRGCRRLVVVSPHPDDEVLGCGGLIRAAARFGLPVRIVSATDGEACFPGDTPSETARTRRTELVRALRVLGVPAGAVQALGLPDGAGPRNECAIRTALHGTLRSTDLVLSTWELDGHPDHEAIGRGARAAASRRGARYACYPIWAWHWLGEHQAADALGSAVRCFLSPAARQAKASAIAEFGSQLHPAPPRRAILPPNVQRRFVRDFEVFAR